MPKRKPCECPSEIATVLPLATSTLYDGGQSPYSAGTHCAFANTSFEKYSSNKYLDSSNKYLMLQRGGWTCDRSHRGRQQRSWRENNPSFGEDFGPRPRSRDVRMCRKRWTGGGTKIGKTNKIGIDNLTFKKDCLGPENRPHCLFF